MTKNEFIEKIKEILLIEDEVDMDYNVKIDSLASLLLIEFYDENFGFRITSETLKKIKTLSDFVLLVKEKLL
jgi:acyl carrier protein